MARTERAAITPLMEQLTNSHRFQNLSLPKATGILETRLKRFRKTVDMDDTSSKRSRNEGADMEVEPPKNLEDVTNNEIEAVSMRLETLTDPNELHREYRRTS